MTTSKYCFDNSTEREIFMIRTEVSCPICNKKHEIYTRFMLCPECVEKGVTPKKINAQAKKTNHTCIYCNQIFSSRNKNPKFCGREHRKLWTAEHNVSNCKNCNKVIPFVRYMPKIFCSNDCRTAYAKSIRKGKSYVEAICQNPKCGKVYSRRQDHTKQKGCSPKCGWEIRHNKTNVPTIIESKPVDNIELLKELKVILSEKAILDSMYKHSNNNPLIIGSLDKRLNVLLEKEQAINDKLKGYKNDNN